MNMPPRPPQTPGQNRPRQDEPEPSPGRFLTPPWLWWVGLALIILWNVYTFLVPKAPPAASLSYSTFLDQVRAGNVATVTMSGQNLEGTFGQPVNLPTNPQGQLGPLATPGGTGQPQQEQTAPFTRFTTVMPVQGDDRLLPLLEEKGVKVSARDVSGGSGLVDLLLGVLPMLVFIGLLFFMIRQGQRNQQSVFSFGGSRARMYNEEHPSVTFADVAGADDAKAELQEVVDFLKNPQKYRALGARLPRGILLVGPPGTGKTLMARAVAGEAHVPFFSISASEFVEMFVGVGASRVRDLFAKAKAVAPAIVFVDEIDAVGRQRGAGLGGGNDEREQTLNQLLVEMDGFDEKTNLIVLAATNRPDVLDPALLRPGRFDRQVTIGLPDRDGREAILRIHTKRLTLGDDVRLDILARRTPGFSGADLANLANEAALVAARHNGDKVRMKDFDEAMDKIVLGTKLAILQTPEERRLVAYHEGGHALVAKLTPGADPVNKITIIPRGRALGVTEQLPEEDRHNYPKDYLLGRLASMLGGRAAEELVFGQPTTGAENDLKQATALAKRMVGLWGMSDELGPVSYGTGESHPFLGREISGPREYGEATASELDMAIRQLIERARDQAKSLLEQHRPVLDAIAEELLAKETVDGQRLNALLSIHGDSAAEDVEPSPPTPAPA